MSTPAKSHNVCSGCRSRKKKCDGSRPFCSSCLRRGEPCFYAGAPSRRLGVTLPGIPFQQDWTVGVDYADAAGAPPYDDPWAPAISSAAAGPFAAAFSGADLPPLLDLQQPSLQQAIPSATWPASFGEDGDMQQPDLLRPPPPPPPASAAKDTADDTSTPPLPPPLPFGLATPPDPPSPAGLPDCALPPQHQLVELADLFFEKFYQYLPILHRQTFMAQVRSGEADDGFLLLLFALLSVSAASHPDRDIQQKQRLWFGEAKGRFTKALHSQNDPLKTLQAANCIIFQAMMGTEFSVSWMVLGQAWRMAAITGCTYVDAGAALPTPRLRHSPWNNWIEKECIRRAVWSLFIFDRGLCYPVGLSHAIDDRKIHANLPMSDDEFQGLEEPRYEDPIRYTSKLDVFITAIQEKAREGKATVPQYIVLAHALLGQVAERIYSPDYDFEEQKPQLDKLTSHLLRIRLMLPRSATHLSAASYRDFTHVVWLSVVLNTATLFLYHHPLREEESLDGPSGQATNWPHCVAAARNSVSLIRDAARASTDLVINPHISSMLFACGRVIVMEYMAPSTSPPPTGNTALAQPTPGAARPRDAALRDDIDVLLFTFERLKEALSALGKKFRNGLLYTLQQPEAEVREYKAAGSRGLLRSADKWPAVDSQGPAICPL